MSTRQPAPQLDEIRGRAKTWFLLALILTPGVALTVLAFLDYPSPWRASGPVGASPLLRALTPALLSVVGGIYVFVRRESVDQALKTRIVLPVGTLVVGALAVNELRYWRSWSDGAMSEAGCALVVLIVPVIALNLVSRWWRAEWLSLAAGLGLIGGGLGLYWTAVAFLDAVRAEVGSTWPVRYYPLLVDTSGELLFGSCVGAVVGMALSASCHGPRLLSWLVRGVAVVAVPLLGVLTFAARRVAWTPGPVSPELPPFTFVPDAWVALGAQALVLGCAGFLVGIVTTRRSRRAAIGSPSAGPAYRAAAGAELADAAVDAAERFPFEQLRWEVAAVGLFCIGLAPLLAAARAGLL